MSNKNIKYNGLEIAVIGMAGRFADAANLEQFWNNVKNGVESIQFMSDDEIQQSGVPAELLNNPAYVRCKGGVLKDKEYFDAQFFKYLPNEAEILAPQTRLFHECAWEAMEDAGYDSSNYNGMVGLYAGSSNVVLWEALVDFSGIPTGMDRLHTANLSSKEFLCSQTSYKMSMTGPSVYVQTACSTSLVAINNACRALLTGECTMALAGGVSVAVMNNGYLYEEGMISSKDGHVRAFDSQATGAVSGEGAGVVVLKLLKNALKDGDNIHAIIKASYTNNDGDEKVGFTAPGVNGQAKVIRSAIRMSGIEPESISYVETHGTATALGDITEIEALKLAFNTTNRNYCAIGSVKTNIGHLDAAAGVAGFIKTVLALKNRQIPPSLHFEKPNPHIGFERSPFYVNTKLKNWENDQYPLRAGVSSFGIGGTNAHVIVEEAPALEHTDTGRSAKLLLLSAKTPAALDSMSANLAKWLQHNKDVNLSDVCYTLQCGRREFPFRRKIVVENAEQAIKILSDTDKRGSQMYKVSNPKQKAVFLFSGLGSQYVGMCQDLYESEPLFKEEMDKCFALFQQLTGYDVKAVLYPDAPGHASTLVHDIETGQYLVFVIEYCLAKLLMAWGIKPHAIVGYSFGEYVAACIAGVFSLEDAIRVIHKRGQLIKRLPEGLMLSVPLAAEELTQTLNGKLSLAIDNGPSCVIAGPEDAIESFEGIMKEKRLMCMRLESTRAVHSKMMDGIMHELREFISTISLNSPQIPYISNVTGDWIRDVDATDPDYWTKHLRQTVHFYKGIKKLLEADKFIYLEIGPGGDISALVNRELELAGIHERAINFVKPNGNATNDHKYLLHKLGQLWAYGVQIDWNNYYRSEKRRRVSLPTYPFERKRYWKLIDQYKAGNISIPVNKSASSTVLHYVPAWKRSSLINKLTNTKGPEGKILIFKDEHNIADNLLSYILNADIVTVSIGERYSKSDEKTYRINPASPRDYELLFADLKVYDRLPAHIIHLFSISAGTEAFDKNVLEYAQDLGYYSVLYIAQALSSLVESDVSINVIGNEILDVTGNESLNPGKATILGPVRVIQQEMPNIRCRYLDIESPLNDGCKQNIVRALFSQISHPIGDESVIALRGDYTWVPHYEQTTPPPVSEQTSRLKENGVYLITGGLGGIALSMADFLAKEVKARLVLIGRSYFPAEEQWNEWLNTHDIADATSQKIKQLQQVQQHGGEVMVVNADIGDVTAMKNVIRITENRWGRINGVIHSATVPDGAMIAVREKSMSQDIFNAKLIGTMVVDELLNEHNLDFTIYNSTLSSVLGGFGQVGYCAANIFMDAFARYRAKNSNVFSLSVNWDRWANTGIAKIIEQKHEELTHEKMEGGLDVHEALHSFKQILGYENISQVIVSKTELATSIERSRRTVPVNMVDIEPMQEAALPARLPRPDLSEAYEAPATELQSTLVRMWEVFFGIEKIGVNDNFFELGGDSLKSMVLVKRMKKDLNYDASIKLFFAKPTIKQIAEEITDVRLLLQTKKRSSKITI